MFSFILESEKEREREKYQTPASSIPFACFLNIFLLFKEIKKKNLYKSFFFETLLSLGSMLFPPYPSLWSSLSDQLLAFSFSHSRVYSLSWSWLSLLSSTKSKYRILIPCPATLKLRTGERRFPCKGTISNVYLFYHSINTSQQPCQRSITIPNLPMRKLNPREIKKLNVNDSKPGLVIWLQLLIISTTPHHFLHQNASFHPINEGEQSQVKHLA